MSVLKSVKHGWAFNPDFLEKIIRKPKIIWKKSRSDGKFLKSFT